ncbi:MAG: DNA/RNA nuclease SfsA [Desulfuromonadaceae bacterium]|nr:DNA/RNA nuclease SfsA [Desulfuromonadaceae bacterium]
MKLPPLRPATLLRRYQRFLADIEWPDGSRTTVHTPNTGSMMQCAVPGSAVLVSDSGNAERKYPQTLELIQVNGHWVDINTQRSNRVVAEALQSGVIDGLSGFAVQPERKLGDSRIDFLLTKANSTEREDRLWLEVKNVTLMGSPVCACFPDAVTERGRRHLQELMAAVAQGDRAAVLFLVQRAEAELFSPAGDIDPAYADQLRAALEAGVEVFACQSVTSADATRIARRLPVVV